MIKEFLGYAFWSDNISQQRHENDLKMILIRCDPKLNTNNTLSTSSQSWLKLITNFYMLGLVLLYFRKISFLLSTTCMALIISLKSIVKLSSQLLIFTFVGVKRRKPSFNCKGWWKCFLHQAIEEMENISYETKHYDRILWY